MALCAPSIARPSQQAPATRPSRAVLGLGTAQRNVAAAVLVATHNFAAAMTAPFILVASVGLPLMLLPTARLLDRRSEAAATPVAPDLPSPAGP